MNSTIDESIIPESPILDRICYGCAGDLREPGCVCPHCGWDNTVRSDGYGHLPATTIGNGRYFVGRALGSGGFGVTYIGRDLQAGSLEYDARRAIKEYFPVGMAIRNSEDGKTVLPASSEYSATIRKLMVRARREGEACRRASDRSGNVVKAYDCLDENGTTYIVMEYIEGDTLTSIVRDSGPINWKEALELFMPVLDALERMHSFGIYHMDISPDNIMLRKTEDGSYGEPVILDFGASLNFRSDAMTRSKSSVAVHDGYTPPEQYGIEETANIDTQKTAVMDEYAVCATLYFAITGKTPPSAINRLTTGKRLVPLSSYDKTVPERFDGALLKGLSLNDKDRYSSVEKLKEALQVAGPSSRVLKIAAGAVLLCVAGVAVFLLTRSSARRENILSDGTYVWVPDKPGTVGELVGTSKEDGMEIRYTLSDGESVNLTELTEFTWNLEETGTDGTKKIKDLVYPGQ